MCVWRNIMARSCNLCCSGKARGITYSECVCVSNLSYPARKAHAPCFIVMCVLSGEAIFLHTVS